MSNDFTDDSTANGFTHDGFTHDGFTTDGAIARPTDTSRRELLKRGALLGAVVWAAPMVKSVPAFAQAAGSPGPDDTLKVFTKAAGLRIKRQDGNNDVYLGQGDLGTAANRADAPFAPLEGVDYALVFSVSGSTLTLTITPPGSASPVVALSRAIVGAPSFPSLAEWNAVEVFVRDDRVANALQLKNISITPGGPVSPANVPAANTGGSSGVSQVERYSYSPAGTFTLTATLNALFAVNSNEASKFEIFVGRLA